MAAGGHLESYLNRDVSVITTREIRYHGELAAFDKENRTITLKNVHNLGTEDRVAAMRLFPSAKTYDFVVFHAAHLKDFKATPRDAEDPAIVSCVGERPSRSSQGVMNMLEHQAPQATRPGRVRNIDIQQVFRGSGDRRQLGMMNRKQNNDHLPRSKGTRRVSFKESGSDNVRGSRDRSSSYTHIPHIPRSMLMRFVNAKQSDSQSGSRKSGRSTPGQFVASKTAKMKFDDDFDFQKALEDFENLSMNNKEPEKKGAEDVKGAKDYYDKGKSFFDNLSTTTADAPKRTRKDEFEANKVTFGVSHIRREKWRRPSIRHHQGRRRGGHNRLTA